MPLRFFADHCVSNYIIKTLRDEGHEVLRLKDHVPADSPDSVVIAKAQELNSILISLNCKHRSRSIPKTPVQKYTTIVIRQSCARRYRRAIAGVTDEGSCGGALICIYSAWFSILFR